MPIVRCRRKTDTSLLPPRVRVVLRPVGRKGAPREFAKSTAERRLHAPGPFDRSPRQEPLFDRFLEIEEGHVTIVQGELDAVQGLGFWFDVMEFSLEAV